jgi:hypothetical protein
MDRITLSEDEIPDLDSYFEQIHLARPILYYQEATNRAKHAAASWQNIWRYLIELDDYSVPSNFSEHVLDIGFFMIYSQSVSEHLLNLLIVDEFGLDTEHIYSDTEGPSLVSLRIDEKLSLLKMKGKDLSDDLGDRQTRNRFAHDVQIVDFFLSSNNDSTVGEIVSEAYEIADELCEAVYDRPITEVANLVRQINEFYTAEELNSAPAGSILLESIERPEGITLETNDLAALEIEELHDELGERGFSPEEYEPADSIVYPHVDAEKPVGQHTGVVIDEVESSVGLSTNITNRIKSEVVCYTSEIERTQYIHNLNLAIDIEDSRVVTKDVGSFEDYSFRRRAEPSIEFDLDSLPNQPWIRIGIMAVGESEHNYFTDFWQKEIPNVDWIRKQRRSAESNITSLWLLIETHTDFDLDSYDGEEDSLSDHISVDEEFMEMLPLIEGLLNSARAKLIRANDPVKIIDKDELPPPVKIIPVEDQARVEMLEVYINHVEHTNQKMKSELESLLFEFEDVEEYYQRRGN